MFEQYTEKAAHVLKQAKKVSAELGQNYVGTEHILIALLREGGCAAAELLAERKVEESTVEELIRQLISPEGGVLLQERSGFTPRAEKVLEEAQLEAERFHEEKDVQDRLWLKTMLFWLKQRITSSRFMG